MEGGEEVGALSPPVGGFVTRFVANVVGGAESGSCARHTAGTGCCHLARLAAIPTKNISP